MKRGDEAGALAAAAHGGRVASSGFLDPVASSALAAALRREGAGVSVGGGFPGARRRVVTAHPTHVPEASRPLVAVYLAGLGVEELLRLVRTSGVEAGEVGDAVPHADGASVVTLDPPPATLERAAEAAGRRVERVPIDRVASGSRRTDTVVVPSLRIDALGAKGFRTSRSWFTKGIEGGNVYLDGLRVGKGETAEEGQEVFADGLGFMRLVSVEGETRRGNLRVTVEVERATS